uniref:NADH dehydrogenase subunit 4 n=1 Tax=Glauconome virens TaxID=457868 RepID=UPI00315C5BCB
MSFLISALFSVFLSFEFLKLGSVFMMIFSVIFLVSLFLGMGLYVFYGLMNEWAGCDLLSVLMVLMVVAVLVLSLSSMVKEVSFGKNDEMKEKKGIEIPTVLVSVVSIMVFMVSSWMDFFFFFEFSLIPTLWLILGWGYQPERLQAGVFMVMYTVSASLPLFLVLLLMWIQEMSDKMLLVSLGLNCEFVKSSWVWIFIILGFLVKLPIYFFHGWLPKAHVEAPLGGSMILAGVLLKLGGYGVIRFSWVVSMQLEVVMLSILVLSLWGGMISSVLCLVQSDLKSLIAYSSIGHMAMSLGGMVSFYGLGKLSGVGLMFAHGLCSPCLFSLAASMYDWSGSRSVALNKNLLRVFPIFSFFWFSFCVLNMGVPPSLNFLSEVFCVAASFWLSWVLFLPSGMMCFMAGCYCLFLYSVVNHGSSLLSVYPKTLLNERYLYGFAFSFFVLMAGIMMLDYFFV